VNIETKTSDGGELERLRSKLHDVEKVRLEDRLVHSQEFGALKVQMTAFETRLSVVEDGVKRLMTHSTWLLRLLIGGIGAAALQYIMENNYYVQ
jgi:hypothetical protein